MDCSVTRRHVTYHAVENHKECFDMIVESSKSNYPQEFGALLRVDRVEKTTIIEVVLLLAPSQAIPMRFFIYICCLSIIVLSGLFILIHHRSHDHRMLIWIYLVILGESISSLGVVLWGCHMESVRLYRTTCDPDYRIKKIFI